MSRFTTAMRAMVTAGLSVSERASMLTCQPASARCHWKWTRLKLRLVPEIAGL